MLSSMTAANLIGGLIFSGVGFVAFTYGKRMGSFRAMLLGALLMGYPYFVSNTALLYLAGLLLTGALLVFRD